MSGDVDPFSTPEPFSENQFDWRGELRNWPLTQRTFRLRTLREASWHVDPRDTVLATARVQRIADRDGWPQKQVRGRWLLIATDRRLYRMFQSRMVRHLSDWEEYFYADITRWEVQLPAMPLWRILGWRTEGSNRRVLIQRKLARRLQEAVEPQLPAGAFDW